MVPGLGEIAKPRTDMVLIGRRCTVSTVGMRSAVFHVVCQQDLYLSTFLLKHEHIWPPLTP